MEIRFENYRCLVWISISIWRKRICPCCTNRLGTLRRDGEAMKKVKWKKKLTAAQVRKRLRGGKLPLKKLLLKEEEGKDSGLSTRN